MKEQEHALLKVALAQKTLEWDLALPEENWPVMLEALAEVKPRVAARLGTDLAVSAPTERADRLLSAVANVKGPFAQRLAERLAERDEAGTGYLRDFSVPGYIEDALSWLVEPEIEDPAEPGGVDAG